MSEAEVSCDVRNHVAFVTLNRPAALNALSLAMVIELTAVFRRCASDTDVHAVLLRGAGDRAFCAGGDVRAVYRSFRESSALHRDFFALEYPLDYSLHAYPKPYIALMDGITMGGGMGLAQGSTLRIVGERTRIAMPEVGIGLFPDVGASYFLSRLPGCLGPYLALTGTQLRAADALHAGLADVYLAPAASAALADDLAALQWHTDRDEDVRALVHARASPAPASSLSLLRSVIDRHFSHDTVQAMLASLDGEVGTEHAEWARQTAALMRARSPTMLVVTLRQLQYGRTMNLADCLRMELGMVEQCFEQGDFIEGVRALLVDKDNQPRWNPAQLSDVTTASVDAFFRARWQSGAHPLADIEAAALTR
jgi:enoyl-CoA hydratase/carnithine racemase